MSHNKRRGYEEVDSEGVKYLFKADFSFLDSLRDVTCKSLFTVSQLVHDGDPQSIRDVLCCSIVNDNSLEVNKELCEEFITKHGLQECNILANTMMANSMLGDIKKKQISTNQKVSSLIDGLLISRSKIFKNHVLLWVYVSLISGVSTCLTIKYYGLLIV